MGWIALIWINFCVTHGATWFFVAALAEPLLIIEDSHH